MTPTQPIRATRAGLIVACLAALALALASCGGASQAPASQPANASSSTGAESNASQAPSASQATASKAPPASQAPASQASASHVAGDRCASTPDASPIATVQWNRMVEGSPKIKAGQAVAFITQANVGPTVTEGIKGTPAANPCIDEVLAQGTPLVVTFYKPGVYNLYCRLAPSIMFTVVDVK